MRYPAIVLFLFGCVDAAALQDPTRPPTPAEIRAFSGEDAGTERRRDLRLQSVLVADNRRIAVINGERLRVGDRIEGARVTRIGTGRVELARDGQTLTLVIHNRPAVSEHGKP